jgi:hypothetical protein
MHSRIKLHCTFASLVLVGFALALFHPALFGGKILAPLDITTTLYAPWNGDANGAKPHNHNPSDAVTQYLPYRIFAEKSFAEDGYIGWNPYEMGGYNLAANTMALPGSWAMQLHRFLPFKDAWNLGIIAEFLIAGGGMLVFLRSRNLPWLPCIIGAVAFMANSQFIIWIYHRWALGSFCWMPWVLWSAAGIKSFNGLHTRQLALPFFLAMAMMGASLQHVAFIFLACLCIFLGRVADFRKPLRETSHVAVWAIAFLLATAMASFTLIPQVQGYLTHISFNNSREGIGYNKGVTEPFFNLAGIFAQIWPWLIGDPQSIDGWKLLKSSFMSHAYLGTIPMVLGICGVFHRAMPKGAKWLIAFGLLLPLTPLVWPLYHRVQLLFLLGAAWMTAEMLARFMTHPQFTALWHKIAVGAVVAIGLALLSGSLLPSKLRVVVEQKVVEKSLIASANSQFGGDQAWIESRARGWVSRFTLHHPRTAWTYGLLVLGTGGLIFASRSRPKNVRWGHIAILAATSLELFTLFQAWTTYSSPEDLQPTHPLLNEVKELVGSNRALQGHGSVRPAEICATPNLLAVAGVPAIDAYESIQYPNVINSLSDLPPAARLDLAGVAISVIPEDTPPPEGTEDWPIIQTSYGFDIRRNPHVPASIISGAGEPPNNSANLPEFLTSGVPINPAMRTMNRLALPVPDGSTWLRISQNWHEGWRWKTVGSGWQPFLKGADNACWIHAIPRGTSGIEVQFFPRPSLLPYISLLACSASVSLILLSMRKSARRT